MANWYKEKGKKIAYIGYINWLRMYADISNQYAKLIFREIYFNHYDIEVGTKVRQGKMVAAFSNDFDFGDWIELAKKNYNLIKARKSFKNRKFRRKKTYSKKIREKRKKNYYDNLPIPEYYWKD